MLSKPHRSSCQQLPRRQHRLAFTPGLSRSLVLSLNVLTISVQTHVLGLPFNPGDWDRLRLYTKRVRSLVVLAPETIPYLQLFADYNSSQTDTVLFPNLQHLYFSPRSLPALHNLSLFLSPSVVSLRLHIRRFPQRWDTLSSILLRDDLPLPSFELCLCPIVCSLTVHLSILPLLNFSHKLTTLALHVCAPFTTEFLTLLSTLPKLQKLNLHFSSADPPIVHIRRFDLTLPSLTHLALSWSFHPTTTPVFDLLVAIAATAPLVHCSMSPHFSITPCEFHYMCSIISQISSIQNLLLRHSPEYSTPPTSSLSYDSSPLLQLVRLRRLDLQGFILGPSFHHNLQYAWTHLRSLSIDTPPPNGSLNHMDVIHLRSVLFQMSHLEYVSVPLRCTWTSVQEVLPLLVPVQNCIRRPIMLSIPTHNDILSPLLAVSYLYIAIPRLTFLPSSSPFSLALSLVKTVISPAGHLHLQHAHVLQNPLPLPPPSP